MRREVTLEFGEFVLSGTFVVIEDSFDHEFGRQPHNDYDLDKFSICMFPEGNELDVTESMLRQYPHRYQALRARLYNHALDQYGDEGAA